MKAYQVFMTGKTGDNRVRDAKQTLEQRPCKNNGKTEVPKSRRNIMLESGHNKPKKECVMAKKSNAVNSIIGLRASLLTAIAAILMTVSCNKEGKYDVTGVTVSPTAVTLKVGDTAALTAKVEPANATNKAVTWNSSDTSVATVSVSGVVTAVSKGTAIIACITGSGAKSATCVVTVTNQTTTKKYITYNQPVMAYYIEYNGGAITANRKSSAGNNGTVIEAYENKKYAYVWWDYNAHYFDCNLTLPNGDWCFPEDGYLNGTVWILDRLNNNENWASDVYLDYEYPLDAFAFWVSKRTLGGGFLYSNQGGLNGLGDIARHPSEATMPDNTDVTQFYVRSEEVCNKMCDVFQILNGGTVNFWVDPATGLTLKLEVTEADGTRNESVSYEVTKLIIGAPDWDGKHLHPLDTDTVKEP
jgi:hypothetical protein